MKYLVLVSALFVFACGDNIQPPPDSGVEETCEECEVCEAPAPCEECEVEGCEVDFCPFCPECQDCPTCPPPPPQEPVDPCECFMLFHEEDVANCLDSMLVLHGLCGRSNYEARFACDNGEGGSVYHTVNVEGCEDE